MRHILLGRLVLGAASVALLSACGDPLRDVARLSDTTVSDGSAAVAEAPSEARATGGGLFSRLLNRQPDDPTNAAVAAALADADITPTSNDPVVVVVEPNENRGLFGLFRSNRSAQAQPDLEVSEVIEDPTATEVVAAVVPAAQPPAPRTGLAGLFRRAPDASAIPRRGPDATDVEPGTVLPFGQVARVCGMGRSSMGTRIEQTAGFSIFDSIPNSTAPRPFYITGFADNCARTFTGAVVVTGDVETHEFVRYRPSNERIEYTTTDNAYEALKASTCRVPRGVPCGERTSRLNRTTQFITVYNFFGGTFSAVPTEWAQILVHDGEILAMSIKDGQ